VLDRIGYDEQVAAAAAPLLRADAQVARVARVDRGIATVLGEDGPHRVGYGAPVLGAIAENPQRTPCTGDWVVLRHWPDRRSTLEQVLPRRTAVVRAVASEQSRGQVLCANADLVAVVVALHPEPVLGKVERMVALAWGSGAQPLVVLTKSDLVDDAALVAADVAAAAPGVEVVRTSTVTGAGLDRIVELVDARRTLALLGSSGHGKSTLANSMVGADVLFTRGLRADGRGRHTSVRRELVVLPGGGAVIDTPGLSGVGLLDADDGLGRTFADIDALAAQCRFGDCGHRGEPGCAVAAAVESGVLPLRRLESWTRLQREVAWIAARTDVRLRAERAAEWRRRRREAGWSRR
jgi:ribosome biogenesis GTPase